MVRALRRVAFSLGEGGLEGGVSVRNPVEGCDIHATCLVGPPAA